MRKRRRLLSVSHMFKKELQKSQSNEMEVTEQWISQPLDHFNKNEAREWQQRFWNNSIFYKQNGPIFLMIGGEDDGGVELINGEAFPITSWAKEYGAEMFYIEQRGYGRSRPTEKATVENLQYITSEQALADMANFIKAVNKTRPNAKWITFGGSYPGSLSAWFREKYPELTVGAVASSAPIQPKVDFFEYMQVCEDTLKDISPQCAHNLKVAFETVQPMFYSEEGRQQLNQLFNFSFEGKHPEEKEIQNHLSELISPIPGYTQYGGPLDKLCSFMINETNSPLQNLAAEYNFFSTCREDCDQEEDDSGDENDDWNG